MSVSERLKSARGALGLKQEELAEKSGVSGRAYQGYEGGRSVPGGEAIEGFVRAGINANWLLTGEGPMLLGDLAKQSAPEPGIDLGRMRLAIEATEEGLDAAQRTMKPKKKAELILAVYELLEEPSVSKERVLKLVKFAA